MVADVLWGSLPRCCRGCTNARLRGDTRSRDGRVREELAAAVDRGVRVTRALFMFLSSGSPGPK
jgi:hypothetical protein